MFKNWDDAREACREIMQCEFGFPSVFRLSDPEETDVAMKTLPHRRHRRRYSAQNTGVTNPCKNACCSVTPMGKAPFPVMSTARSAAFAASHGAFNLSFAPVTSNWEKSRFRDPYMREDLQDFGILIDTLECAVTWSQMEHVHQSGARIHQEPARIPSA